MRASTFRDIGSAAGPQPDGRLGAIVYTAAERSSRNKPKRNEMEKETHS